MPFTHEVRFLPLYTNGKWQQLLGIGPSTVFTLHSDSKIIYIYILNEVDQSAPEFCSCSCMTVYLYKETNAPINVKPEGGGGWANHGHLTLRSVPRVGILIVRDAPRVGILIVYDPLQQGLKDI